MAYYSSAGFRLSLLEWIQGFHPTCVAGESMPAGPLGVGLYLTASALVELCDEGAFGFNDVRTWQLRLRLQLEVANTQFIDICRNCRPALEHSQSAFTPGNLCMATYASSWPMLKARAHNSLRVSTWIADACKRHCTGTAYSKLRSSTSGTYVSFFRIVRESIDPNSFIDQRDEKTQCIVQPLFPWLQAVVPCALPSGDTTVPAQTEVPRGTLMPTPKHLA